MAGPSTTLTGLHPGVLDPSQRTRLLRHPASTLSFAAFDPLAASAWAQKDVPDFRKLSLNEELYRPKRVVVESFPTGESFWRFVPRPRMEEGVGDEGAWPRLIVLCGQLVECSQDQWDIYKLDPEYECYVQTPPKLSTITRVTYKSTNAPPQTSPFNKRPRETPSPEEDIPHPTRKKYQQQSQGRSQIERDVSGFSQSEEDDEDEEEVEGMIIDDHGLRRRAQSAGSAPTARLRLREEIDKNRKLRREKISRAEARFSQNGNGTKVDENMFDFSQAGPSTPTQGARIVLPGSPGKRKASSLSHPFCTQDNLNFSNLIDEDDEINGKQYKRSRRTVSPTSARRDIMGKRMERERKKKQKWDCKLDELRREKNKIFMDEVLADVPEFITPIEPNGVDNELGEARNHQDRHDEHSSLDEEAPNQQDGHHEYGDLDEAATRQAAIEESRRKLAELEADRPLWEEHAKMREAIEKNEEDARRIKREQRLREAAEKAETERRAQWEKEQREAMLREEATCRKREETARREWEKRQRQQRWSTGPWTTQRALERYKTLSEFFDGAKFSLDEPLTFDIVPWPVLQSPMSFTVEDVDWSAVEKFFEAMKPHMRIQDYKMFVEKSQRRFHPDRWRSRGLLKSIADEAERGCLEVAANTVAQALTPLWREMKGL